MRDYCRNYSRVAWSSPHPDSGYSFFTRLRCKQWSCDYCAAINSRMWQAHLLDNINRLSDETTRWSFVTLTSNAKIRDAHRSYNVVNQMWRKLSELWREIHRAYGGLNLIYARTLEAHKSGAIHLHAIVGHDVPLCGYVNVNHAKKFKKNRKNFFDKPRFRGRQHWRIGDLAAKYGGGYKAEVTPIYRANAGLVVAYITKYITKDNQSKLDLPKGARRMLTSQQFSEFGKMPEDDMLTWTVEQYLHQVEYMKIKQNSDCLKDMQTGEIIDIMSFNGLTTYPPLEDRDQPLA